MDRIVDTQEIKTLKVLERDTTKTSLRAPYYKIQVGKRDDITQPQGGVSVGVFKNPDEEDFTASISKYVAKVSVTETMEGPEQFEIEIVDNEMRFMFNEQLYLGRHIFVDIGFWQGPELQWKQAAEGFINDMEYVFSETGIPKLIIKGFGLVWDVMDKDGLTFAIRIIPVAYAPPGIQYSNEALPNGTYPSIADLLQKVAKKFKLRIIPGVTMPATIDKVIISLDKYKKDFTISSKGQKSWHGFLQDMAGMFGCWYFPKGRYLHFYPAAWVEAPVMTDEEVIESKAKLEQDISTGNYIDEDDRKEMEGWIKKYDEYMKTSRGYSQAKLLETEGAIELHYKIGKKNIISFNPKLNSLQVSGYMAMSIDPYSGEINFGQTIDGSKDDYTNWSGTKGVTGKMGADGRQMLIETQTEDEVTKHKMMELQGTDVSITDDPEELAAIKQRKIQNASRGPLDQFRTQGTAEANFRNRMWFTEATAVIVGDIKLTCAVPVFVRGLGYQKDSRKLCGKWYVFSVKHVISDKDYTCELNLKRYWQYMNDMNREDTSKKKQGQDMLNMHFGDSREKPIPVIVE